MIVRELRRWLAIAAVIGVSSTRGAEPAKVEFNRQIRPILSDKCFSCHGPDGHHRQAGLRLDTAEGSRADLGGRRAIVPAEPDESELFARIASTDAADQMPPPETGKPLTGAEISLIRRWIEEGAEYQPHWSYISPRRPAIPAVVHSDWSRNAIDQFILSRLEQEGIAPAREAEKVTLARRLCFDLNGLPPAPLDLDEFLSDVSRQSVERLVDRLLASPRFGERLAQYWLDLVRYADSVGYHGDQEHPATPYRDYVIAAFNENRPFDQFTLEQLAGDLLPDASTEQKVASGYNRLLQTSHEGGVQVREYLHKYDADRVRNLGAVWMGATLGCVECHDHKYDPYSQRDFYRFVAFFADVDDLRTFKGGDSNPTRREPELVLYSPEELGRIADLNARLCEAEWSIAEASSEPGEEALDVASIKSAIAGLRKELAAISQNARRSMVTESVAPRTIRVLARGDWMDETGEVVGSATPAFLPGASTTNARQTRLDLARWLTAGDHPQTARVFVNRLWYLFLGNGLCNTLDDTGSQGEWPSHPELLDWLAAEFMESGWDVKHVVRLIVTSATYRQSSEVRPDLMDRDPHNRLCARQSSFRLPAEMIRDQALAQSGLLVEHIGGPSGHPYQPAGYYKFLNFPKREYRADADENQYRRGVYTHWQRQYLHPMLRAFDAPSREECTARRPTSNTPLGALALLNDPTYVEAARVFAARALRECAGSENERVRFAWRVVLGREPDREEELSLTTLLQSGRVIYQHDPAAAAQLLAVGLTPAPDGIDPIELAAWTGVARALFNLHETITRE